MLRYGDTSDLKMKFLQAIIEKFSILKKISITDQYLSVYTTYQDRDFTSPSEGSGVQYYRLEPPRRGGGPRYPPEFRVLYQNMQKNFERSLSVI